ncbi:hypothetical protein LCGC14_1250890 [marine sediment metagenome]|uniref:Uncharacterized protein n=1 Tax=marine sediment metagenome TaxID=412755 RepID=A0A0F9L333_9ZZZZ
MDRNKVRKQAQVLRNKRLVREHRKLAAAKAKNKAQVKDKAIKMPKPQPIKEVRRSILPTPPPDTNKAKRQKAVQAFMQNLPPRRTGGCGGCRRRIK